VSHRERFGLANLVRLPSDAVGSDAIIRQGAATETWDFGTTACAIAPPIEGARVAIVTTAGLIGSEGGTWTLGQGYVVHPDERRDVRLAHASSNFDRSGFAADINVVYPIDRLHELAAEGRIESVAAQHISFMGAQPDHVLETLRLDTGPAAAKILRDDGVDVVLLTPV
jgi:D-proline reductase (dithiol) PrdB